MVVFIVVWALVVFAVFGIVLRIAYRRGRREEHEAQGVARGGLLYASPIRLVEDGGSHMPNAYVIEVYERQIAAFMKSRLGRYTSSALYLDPAEVEVSWDEGTRYLWSTKREAGVRLRYRKSNGASSTAVAIPLDGSAQRLYSLLTGLAEAARSRSSAPRDA